MNLSTSTNILFLRPDGSTFPIETTLRMAHEAGFDAFDLCFYDWVLPGSPFLTGRWRHWAEGIVTEAQRLGACFHQCHVHFYNFMDPTLSQEERERQQMLVLRSIECAALVGAKVCVTHPETDFWSETMVASSRKANREYFLKLLEQTRRFGVSIAIENMCDYSIAPKRKFCADAEELVDFVSDFRDSRVGICWDFEHGDIMEQNQCAAIEHIGSHLLATHVSDTHSKTEEWLMHVMPLFGKTDWPPILHTLRKIGYKGDFSFEAHNYANRIPDALLPEALRLSYKIGKYLIGLE